MRVLVLTDLGVNDELKRAWNAAVNSSGAVFTVTSDKLKSELLDLYANIVLSKYPDLTNKGRQN